MHEVQFYYVKMLIQTETVLEINYQVIINHFYILKNDDDSFKISFVPNSLK